MITFGLAARAALFAVVAMLLNVLVSVLWVGLYSAAIDPGHDLAFYEAYANRVVPMVSLIAGVPLLLLAGWLIGRGRGGREAVSAGALVGVAYAVIDLVILLLLAGGQTIPWGEVALSYVTKIAAAAAGGWLAARGAVTRDESLAD